MACGLKKQNNKQGGVHLTERTCSPYNPIIKLMVDDCLGLPIYPVTSVDAVIDEDGYTLRKLLEDLLDKINSGKTESDKTLLEILELLEHIRDTYVNVEEFDNHLEAYEALKRIVYAIGNMHSISTSGNEAMNDIPTIVTIVLQLLEAIDNITGGNNSLSLSDIIDILTAVANFDTTFDPESDYQGITADNHKLKIIKEILDIKDLLGTGGLGTLSGRVEALESLTTNLKLLLVALANYDTTATISELDNLLGLENTDPELNTSGIVSLIYKISTILDKIDNKADLDEILLDQGVKKLKNSEYPITSTEFISYSAATGEGTKISIRYGRPYYFCLSKNYTRKEWCDIYPIHEVDTSEADNYADAWQLFEKVDRRLGADVVGVDSNGDDAYFKAAKSSRGKLLFVGGDRLIGEGEMLSLIDVTLGNNTNGTNANSYKLYYRSPDLSVENPVFYATYDLNLDGETGGPGGVADINCLIDNLLPNDSSNVLSINASPTFWLTSDLMHNIFNTFKARYYPNDATYTFDHFWKANIFVFNQEDEMPIIYPLIEGKLYLRQNSNSIYYFNGEELVGTKDLTIVQTSNNILNPVVKNGTTFTIQPPVGVAEAVTAEDEEFEYENEKVYLLQTETCYVKFIFTRSALFGSGDELLVDLDYKKVTVDGEERIKLYNKNGNMPFFSVPYVTAMIAFYTSLGATLNSSNILMSNRLFTERLLEVLEMLKSYFEEDYPLDDNLNYDENGYIYFTEPEDGASRTAQVAYELYTDLIGILFPDGPFSDYFPEIPLILKQDLSTISNQMVEAGTWMPSSPRPASDILFAAAPSEEYYVAIVSPSPKFNSNGELLNQEDFEVSIKPINDYNTDTQRDIFYRVYASDNGILSTDSILEVIRIIISTQGPEGAELYIEDTTAASTKDRLVYALKSGNSTTLLPVLDNGRVFYVPNAGETVVAYNGACFSVIPNIEAASTTTGFALRLGRHNVTTVDLKNTVDSINEDYNSVVQALSRRIFDKLEKLENRIVALEPEQPEQPEEP